METKSVLTWSWNEHRKATEDARGGGIGEPGSGGGSAAAYTEFTLRLDNRTELRYGPGQPNLLAIYVDGTYGHEHWYAGAGLYRSVHMVRTAPAYQCSWP